MGRADANFNYCISWDCGGATVGDLTGVRSPLPYADCAYLIGHFYRVLARRTADYRIVYVFGHAAVVYGRRHQYRQIDPRAGWRDPVSVSICCGSRARWITGAA